MCCILSVWTVTHLAERQLLSLQQNLTTDAIFFSFYVAGCINRFLTIKTMQELLELFFFLSERFLIFVFENLLYFFSFICLYCIKT